MSDNNYRKLGIAPRFHEVLSTRQTGIPTSKAGLERKIGKAIIKGIFGK